MTTTDEDPFDDGNADPFDPADQDVEPLDEEDEGEGASETTESEATEAGKTPAQAALAAASGDQRSEVLALAHRLNLPADDPAWLVVRAALDAQGAAAVATEAVGKLTSVPDAIERAALTGASNAAAEIKQHAEAGGEAVVSRMTESLRESVARPLAEVLKPWVETLDTRAGEIRRDLEGLLNERSAELTRDFMRRANKAIDARAFASKTVARITMLLTIALGAAIGVAGVRYEHRLAPTPIHRTASGGYSIVVPNGFGGRFQRCGHRECVYLYPPRARQKGGGK